MKTLWFAPFLCLAACADGGKEDRPAGDVAFTAQHHLYGFRSLRGFGPFPVPASAVATDRGVLNLFDTSDYTVTRATGTSGEERYALAKDGTLSIYIRGNSSEPSVVFRGGYDQVGTQGDYFFTDRISTNSSPSIGLYYGTRILNGQVELEGGWHLLSLHTIFDAAIQDTENVARGAYGAVTIDAGAPGTLRALTGTGLQGTSSVTFTGSIQNLLNASDSGDGTCNLTVGYQLAGQSVDSRVMLAAANANVVFGLDADETDGEAGLLLMVRKFNAPTTPVDSVRVPGTFLVGGQTIFVNPNNSGSDTFVGLVTLSAQGAFRLDATGANGQDFSYAGTYTLAADGGMTVQISGTNETWFAAIDRSYNTLAFVDGFEEIRPNNSPELNFGFGVRRKD